MKFIVGDKLTKFKGYPGEIRLVQKLLTDPDDLGNVLYNTEQEFYSGLTDWVVESLKGKIEVEVVDKRTAQPFSIQPEEKHGVFTLRDYQLRVVQLALAKSRGLVEFPTGAGKTVTAASIIKEFLKRLPKIRVIFVVPRVLLCEQTAESFVKAGMPRESVGILGGAHSDYDKQITVSTVQTLYSGLKRRNSETQDLLSSIGLVIFDEVHHLSSDSWIRVAGSCDAPYRYGLSASLWEDPNEIAFTDRFFIGLTGDVLLRIPTSYLISRGFLAKLHVMHIELPHISIPVWDWHKVYARGVTENESLNQCAANLAKVMYERSSRVLVLVQQIKHGEKILEKLNNLNVPAIFFKGGNEVKKRYNQDPEVWPYERLSDYVSSNDASITIATGVLGEGVDLPVVDTLILASGMKKFRPLVQKLGRVLRPKKDNNAYLFDFWQPSHKYLSNHSEIRLNHYAEEGHDILGLYDSESSRELMKWTEEELKLIEEGVK